MASLRLPPLPTISEIIKIYQLRAMKQLSQNFLLDSNILDKIARHADVKNRFVIEIGPGPGGLTRSCINGGATGIAVIEKDIRFMESLQLLGNSLEDKIPYKIYNSDILNISLKTMVPKTLTQNWDADEPNIALVGNLPFNISLPLLFRLLKQITEKYDLFEHGRVPMTFAFQKEVCDRLISKPNTVEYSRISILAQYLCDVQMKFIISGKAFVPKPKVDVGILKLVPLKTPLINHKFETVDTVVKAIFRYKNKHWYRGFRTLFNTDFKEFDEVLKTLNIEREKTAYNITFEDIQLLCDVYKKFSEKQIKQP